MDRLDKILVERNFVNTRSQAQQLIKEGVVLVDGQVCLKPSFKTQSKNIKVTKEEIFVGRGAHKVEGALKDFSIDVTDKSIADVGASTGGFTQYVLTRAAAKVYAIDVGHDQLAKELREDQRVINMEGVNIRELNELPEMCDLAVVDLSFISITLCLKNIFSLIHSEGKVICLIKPQFEVGKEGLSKNGLVKDEEASKEVLKKIYQWSGENHFFIRDFTLCSIKGKTGNQEFFFYYDKSLKAHGIEFEEIEKRLAL